MNVFELRDRLVRDYDSYTRSFIKIADSRIAKTMDAELAAGALWPEPLLQLNPTFLAGGTIDDLARLKEWFPTPRNAVAYILDTFPIVRDRDIERTEKENVEGEIVREGTYITKDTILKIFDAMQEAIRTGMPYKTRLNPPPADPSLCHPPRNAPV